MSQTPIIIIGNGIAGTTLARQLRKRSQKPIVIISKESDFFFSRTALMYVYMGHLTWEQIEPFEKGFWKKNKIDLLHDEVVGIDHLNQSVELKNGERIAYDQLVLATGSVPNKFGWKGQDYNGVQGLYSRQDLELLEAKTPQIKRAVIVGGGLIGIELAEMLHSRDIPVTFLVREQHFWNNVIATQESKMIEQQLREHRIDLRLQTNLVEILGDENDQVVGVKTDQDEIIPCEFVGLTAGVRPNIDFLHNTAIERNRGILVDDYLQTNLPNIYAIGDCAEIRQPKSHRRSVEAVWYVGRMMGETLAITLSGHKKMYSPSHWFNSAKFFDLEYQTYGNISPEENENEAHFMWQHPTKSLAIRMAYQPKTQQFLGINAFGIRLRHECFEKWLNEKVSISHVITRLDEANFDPEFYTQYHKNIKTLWKTE